MIIHRLLHIYLSNSCHCVSLTLSSLPSSFHFSLCPYLIYQVELYELFVDGDYHSDFIVRAAVASGSSTQEEITSFEDEPRQPVVQSDDGCMTVSLLSISHDQNVHHSTTHC